MSLPLQSSEMPKEYNSQSMWQIIRRIVQPLRLMTQGFLFYTVDNAPILADYEVPKAVDFVPVDATAGNVTITIADADECRGKRVTVKKIDSSANTVTVSVKSGGTIDDATTQVINFQYTSICLMSANDEWWIV